SNTPPSLSGLRLPELGRLAHHAVERRGVRVLVGRLERTSLGTRAERPQRRTANCCVRTTIEENRANKRQIARQLSAPAGATGDNARMACGVASFADLTEVGVCGTFPLE